LVAAAVASMVKLNRGASEALQSLPSGAVHACTDVTGFGLAGHACEVAAASGVTLEIDAAAIPVIEGVATLVPGNIPGGGRTNAAHFGPDIQVVGETAPNLLELFHDPQTSGGLLVSVDASQASAAFAALTAVEPATRRVGRVVPRHETLLVLR
jgi:selenide,water dikinase